jgi:uncharacterized protein (TIGR02145 family)
MRKLLCLIGLFCSFIGNAQNYLISFAGTGSSTSVSTVKVENLTKATTLTLNGNDVLRLTVATVVKQSEDTHTSRLKIYPNPMVENSTLEIFPVVEGDAVVTICDMTGKKLTQIQCYLETTGQDFKISGLNNGLYLINVQGKGYQLSGKLISYGNYNGKINFERVSVNTKYIDKKASEKTDSKGMLSTVDMEYSTGDILKFTATSGDYSTVNTFIPVSDSQVTFNFLPCADGDNNNYSVVQIGTQIWMAENLRTTKYNDGAVIPLITDINAWAVLTTPGYCWYNNDEATFKNTYGGLYNWYVTDISSNGGKEVCPTGWHLPSDAEWTTLSTFLGGESIAGGKMKETGTTHWASPNSDATNESGFTSIPGGSRYFDGTFDLLGQYSQWWSSSEFSIDNSWFRYLAVDNGSVTRISDSKQYGLSLRCFREIIIGTETAINDSLIICYSKLYDYIKFAYLFDAIYSNYTTAPGTSWDDIYNHAQTATNEKVLKLWSDAYDIILRANLIISSSQQVVTDIQARDIIIAQAKAIKAYLNYNLLTWFGEVPIETGISESIIPRNTVDEVLTQIKSDATDAGLSLPLSWTSPDNFRIPKSFANGLLARAALYSKNYNEAGNPTTQIINSGQYMLETSATIFTSSSREIFVGFEEGTNAEFNSFFTKGTYVPAMRYTESILTNIEVQFGLGNMSGAVSFMNLLKSRSGMPTVTSITEGDILQQWNTELDLEGGMFAALKRFNSALTIVGGQQFKLLLPVPQSKMISNVNLTQNPGY